MAILRKRKKDNFTVIDNTVFYDKTLSFKAKGLLCQMLSLQDGWTFSVGGLAGLSSDGITTVRTALSELEQHAYVKRTQVRDHDGKIAGVEYVVSETPMQDLPISEKPISDRRTLLNTNKSNTNKSNTNSVYDGLPTELISALKDFEDMRKRIKSPLSDRARQMLLGKLDKLAGSDTQKKIAILEQSIFNSWKGVYDIDDRGGDQKRRGMATGSGTGRSTATHSKTKLPPVEESLCVKE